MWSTAASSRGERGGVKRAIQRRDDRCITTLEPVERSIELGQDARAPAGRRPPQGPSLVDQLSRQYHTREDR